MKIVCFDLLYNLVKLWAVITGHPVYDYVGYVMCSAASSRVQQPVTSVYRTDAPSVGTRLVIATEKQDR